MGYLDRMIPAKYRAGKKIPALQRKLLFNSFTKEGICLLKEVVSLGVDYFKEDLEILNDKLFRSDEFDFIYSEYDITPIESRRMKELLKKIRFIEKSHLFIIVDFLVKNNIGTEKIPSKNLLKLKSILDEYKKADALYEKICIRKNFIDLEIEYNTTKLIIEGKLNSYYNSISA